MERLAFGTPSLRCPRNGEFMARLARPPMTQPLNALNKHLGRLWR